MALSKREKYIFFGSLAAVGLLALDLLVFSPLWDMHEEAANRRAKVEAALAADKEKLAERNLVTPKWQEMVRGGMKADADPSVSQLIHAIGDWADEAGVSQLSLKIDRPTDKSRLPQVVVQATGVGSMNAVARMLYRIQTATIPVKVTELQISSRKEGIDDLSVQMKISTVYAPGKALVSSMPAEAKSADSNKMPTPRRTPRRPTRSTPTTWPSGVIPPPESEPTTSSAPATSSAPSSGPSAATQPDDLPPDMTDDPGDQ